MRKVFLLSIVMVLVLSSLAFASSIADKEIPVFLHVNPAALILSDAESFSLELVNPLLHGEKPGRGAPHDAESEWERFEIQANTNVIVTLQQSIDHGALGLSKWQIWEHGKDNSEFWVISPNMVVTNWNGISSVSSNSGASGDEIDGSIITLTTENAGISQFDLRMVMNWNEDAHWYDLKPMTGNIGTITITVAAN